MHRSQLSRGASQELLRKEEESWCAHTKPPKGSRRGMCAYTHSHRHAHRLHPTPPLHRRSCPVLTGAHLPQPEAINTTTTPSITTNPPHSTPYQLSLHTFLLFFFSSLTQPLSVYLAVSVCPPPTPSCKHTLLSFTREILPCSSAVMKCIFLPLIQSLNAVCRNGLWIHYFIAKTGWKRK